MHQSGAILVGAPGSLLSDKYPSTVVATQIMNGANMALPAGSLCITRRLYHISRLKTVRITKSEVCSMVHVGPSC